MPENKDNEKVLLSNVTQLKWRAHGAVKLKQK